MFFLSLVKQLLFSVYFSYSKLEQLGLTSDEAYRRIVAELQELIGANSSFRHWIAGIFLPPYRFINVLLTNVSGVALLISYFVSPEWNLLAEGIILFLLGAVNLYLLVRETHLNYTGCLRKLKDAALKLVNNAPTSYPDESIATSRGQLTVCVIRDNKNVHLPASLLVSGDIVLLEVNQVAPANVVMLSDTSINLSKGEAVTDKILGDISNNYFKVKSSPILPALQAAISHRQTNTILENERDHVYFVIHAYIFWLCLLLLVILAIVSLVALSDDSGSWENVIFSQTAYALLPLMLLQFPLYWWLGHCFGLAKLSLLLEDKKPSFIQLLTKMVKSILECNVNYSLLHVLGTATTFCAVDKEFLLSSSHPIPEKVFFFRGTEVSGESSIGSLSQKDGVFSSSSKEETDASLEVNNDVESSAGEVLLIEAEILNISPSQDSKSGIFFDNRDWNIYLSSLKPIALCSKVTSHSPKLPHIDVHLSDHLRHTQCSCPLAIEVGVPEINLHPFATIFVANSMRRTRSTSSSMFQLTHSDDIPIHMVSMVIPDGDHYQLMTAGSAHMILSCCTDFWDGQDLVPITRLEEKKIMEFFNRRSVASYCISLSYNPLLEQLEPIKPVCIIKDPSEEVPKQLQGQVFLGMVSLQYQPAPDMVQLVEQLDVAGIRFVHFAAENELQIRGFTEKLGLEVGWNCHISLSPDIVQTEKEKMTNDDDGQSIDSNNSSISVVVNDFEAYTRAKLPKGIKLIRPHIENTDNVPLLVPLFTDCIASSVAEMMLIMQDYGEVVVCIGNSWNVDNIAIFTQADVSIAVEPVDNSAPVSPTHNSPPTQLQAASQLNSTPCDLVLMRNSDANILSLIIHSRHLLSCLRHSLLFGLGSSLLISCLLISCRVFFLPPALSGSHVFWFLLYVLPVLASSLLLSSPNEEELKAKMIDKNNKLWIVQWKYASYFVCSFLTTALVCVLLFAVTLGNVCSELANDDCHALLGDRNETSKWNGWESEYSGGLLLAQNIAAFFLCCYLIVLSLHFCLQLTPLKDLYRSLQLGWVVASFLTISLQVVYFAVSLATNESPESQLKLSLVPAWVWPCGIVWAVILLVIQELIKIRERKFVRRSQKRLRLEFETKLGMNSPF